MTELDVCASRYTGKERDAESGLDYFGARYYGSSMGRFMSPDPSGLYYADPRYPQSLNLYSYVLNNPLKNVDPTGMYCDYSDHNDAASIADDSQQDYHSSESECTAADENGNRGVWVNDADTHQDANGQWVDNDGRPDSAISSNTNGGGNPPLSGDFSFNMTSDQFIAMMQQAGFKVSALDTALGKTGLGHPGTNMRDQFPVCSVHLNINPGTGVNGVPVSGEFHYDLFNPLKSLPGGPQTGDIPLMPFHAAADVGPDILIKKAHTSWTGNQECVTK